MAEVAVLRLLANLAPTLINEAGMLRKAFAEVQEIKEELESMTAFLKDADRRKDNDHLTLKWVQQVRDAAYDVEDIVDRFMLKFGRHHGHGIMARVRKFINSIRYLKARYDIAKDATSIRERINRISERKTMYARDVAVDGSSVNDFIERCQDRGRGYLTSEEDIVGFEAETDFLLHKLLANVPGSSMLKVVSLVGMSGSGKTTLVEKLYNDQRVKDIFDCFAWITVSQNFIRQDLYRRIAKAFCINSADEQELQEDIYSYLQGKEYLIVLDDVWSFRVWRDIKSAFPKKCKRSTVVITTRMENTLQFLDPDEVSITVHHMKRLPEDKAMLLFCKKAFRGTSERICPEELSEIATDMVSKCEGLPLALVALGGILAQIRKRKTEWMKVQASLRWQLYDNSSLDCIRNILALSYHELPLYLKPCFLYCSAFPEDYLVQRNKLIRLWIAEGFIKQRGKLTLEETAEEYLQELIHRNLLIAKENIYGRVKTCRIHDLMRELLICKAKEENFFHVFEVGNQNIVGKCRRLSIIKLNNAEDIFESMVGIPSLRSLLVFDDLVLKSCSFMKLASFNLLRVLDLDGSQTKKLPDGVVELFHLRYLSLRRTMVSKLPKSFGKLQNLQTLDIRGTGITSLPKGILSMKGLRNLCMFDSSSSLVKRTILARIGQLKHLQILTGIRGEEKVIREVGNLKGLKRFEILWVRKDDMSNLCASIQKMERLARLLVHSHESLELDSLFSSPPAFLEAMDLDGCIKKLPSNLDALANIARLKLINSRLSDDPFLCLQSLPNLVWLILSNAYNGPELKCDDSNGFPKLMRLQLSSLDGLESVMIQEGAMPYLKEMYIDDCKTLKKVPQGIEHLANLQELRWSRICPELEALLNKDGGEDSPKVQHISKIDLT